MAAKKPTVFVVQEDRKKNLLAALEYGNLEAVLGPDEQVLLNPDYAVRRIEAKMYRYSDEDYVLAVGDPVAIGIVCAMAAKVNGGVFTVLKWDRQERVYYPVRVDLNATRKEFT